MEEKNKECGTCKYHEHEDWWVCVNEKSEFFSELTEYNDTCKEWEGRK